MTGNRVFESTYVGHFVVDEASFGLRRTSSIKDLRVQGMVHCNPNPSEKISIESRNVIAQSHVKTDRAQPPVATRPTRTASGSSHRTPIRARPTHHATKSLAETSSSIRESSTRVPIWAKSTVSRPAASAIAQSQLAGSVKRTQSQDLLSGSARPKTPVRSSSFPQHAGRANITSQPKNATPQSSPSRSQIRNESPVPRRAITMPTTPTSSSRSVSQPPQRTTLSKESERENTKVNTRVTTGPRRASTILGTTYSISTTTSRNAANTITPGPTSSRPSSSRATTLIPRPSTSRAATPAVTTIARTLQPLRSSLTGAQPQRELRRVASQPLLRLFNSSASKPPAKPARENARLSQPKEQKRKVEEEGECCICMNAQSDCVLYRCGHACACMHCAKELKQCPICREQVIDVIKLWKI